MTRFLIVRLIQSGLVLVLVSLVAFSLLELVPGDPASARVGTELVDRELVERMRQDYGLDKPLIERYWIWLGNAVSGDLGLSTKTRTSVLEEIADRVPATLHVGIGALLIGTLLGVSAGVVSAARSGRTTDRLITLAAIAGISTPEFFLAILAILLFSVQLGWLPSFGYTPLWEDPMLSIKQLAMPCSIVALHISGIIARHTRSSMLEVLTQDYIRTAKAKGLQSGTILVRHSLRNASLPIVTILSLLVGRVFAGSVIIETVFSIPGVGRYLVSGVQNSDYPVVQAVILISAVAMISANFVADILYGVLDPRIKVGGSA